MRPPLSLLVLTACLDTSPTSHALLQQADEAAAAGQWQLAADKVELALAEGDATPAEHARRDYLQDARRGGTPDLGAWLQAACSADDLTACQRLVWLEKAAARDLDPSARLSTLRRAEATPGTAPSTTPAPSEEP